MDLEKAGVSTNMEAVSLDDAQERLTVEMTYDTLEAAITEVWKEVFHLDAIDRYTNFFELGGNSLLGMDLTELLCDRLDIEVSVLTLFMNPSIHEMTQVIAADQ